MFCTQCGATNPDGSRFCASCGAALVAATGPAPSEAPSEQTSTIALGSLEVDHEDETGGAGHEAAVEGLAADTALLVVKRGPNAGSRFLLDRDLTTAGRHPESDIFLDDVTVSRRHAEFHRAGGRFSLRDVGSLNGTYLNRERVDRADLSGGDEVQIGKFRLVFLAGADGEEDGA